MMYGVWCPESPEIRADEELLSWCHKTMSNIVKCAIKSVPERVSLLTLYPLP